MANTESIKLLPLCHSRVGGNPGSNAGLDSLFQGNDIQGIYLISYKFLIFQTF